MIVTTGNVAMSFLSLATVERANGSTEHLTAHETCEGFRHVVLTHIRPIPQFTFMAQEAKNYPSPTPFSPMNEFLRSY